MEKYNATVRRSTIILLLATAAGCAPTTAPVVIRELAPPSIETANIETIALLPLSHGDDKDGPVSFLGKEITAAIEKTGRYKITTAPDGAAPEDAGKIAEVAKAAGADLLIGVRVAPPPLTSDRSTLEATYAFYSGATGEELLSKSAIIQRIDPEEALKGIAEGVARSLTPHAVELTLLLEYGLSQFKLTRVGVHLARVGLWEEAEKKWWIAARTNQADSAAYHNLGVALERRGRYNLAMTAYQNAFVRNPHSPLYAEDIDRIKKKIAPPGT